MFINNLPDYVHTQVDIFVGDTTFLAASDFANVEDLENTPTSKSGQQTTHCHLTVPKLRRF